MIVGQLLYAAASGVMKDEMVRKVITIPSEDMMLVVDKRGNVFKILVQQLVNARLEKDDELDT